MRAEPAALRVLVVDDKEDDYILTRNLFAGIKGGRYDVHWAASFTDALEKVQSGAFDIHLIDLRLGVHSGLDLIRMIDVAGCQTPSILLTRRSDKEIDLEAMKVGAADYLVKGQVDAETLERAVRYAVDRGRAKVALRISEARFRSVVQHSSDLITIVDASYTVTYASPSIERLFGYGSGEIEGRSLLTLAHPDDTSYVSAFLTDARATPNRTLSIDWRVRHADGSWRHAESVMANLLHDPNVAGIVVTTRDTHDRKTLEAQLTHQAFHDPLTGIANRVLFVSRAEHALARARRRRVPVAVLFLDLDDFKTVNDSLGHGAGDALITATTARLKACVRSEDTVARLGGDEFAVLLERTVLPVNAVVVAERIIESLAQPFTLESGDVKISVSVGIALSERGGESSDELLRNADMAMYRAKERGKGRYAIFESEMHEALIARLELETDLRRAIERHECVLHYQPIVRLDTRCVTGFEALVRWNHPVRGPVPPSGFIDIAEETGLIVPLGQWILDEACRRLRRLNEAHGPGLTMTVNVSGKQLQQRDFIGHVAEAIQSSQVDPRDLVLEITETVMMQDTAAALARLTDLKALGVRIAIDDFGTGYSSLNYLQKFSVDILKIDRSFIEHVWQGESASAVARAIIGLSKTLRLSTIAEGIENLEQVGLLASLDCEFGQGYYFSRPIRDEQVDDLLRASRKSGLPLEPVAVMREDDREPVSKAS